MADEEAMEALLNSDGYSFPTWTLKLGLPTDEMRLVMSLIASDKAPIPVDVAYISEYLHMDGAVVESSVKELLDRRLVYKKDSYLILDLEMCDHIFDAAATVRQAKVNSDIDEAFCPPIPLVAMRAGEIYSDSSLVSRLVLGFISAWSFAADFCPYCPHDIAKLLGLYDSDVEDAISFWSDKGLVDRVCGPLFKKERLNVNLLAWKAGWLEGTVSCRIAYVDGGWCCPGEVFLHDTVEWDEVDQSNYVSTDSYGYYVGLCREVLGINGKYQKSCRLP